MDMRVVVGFVAGLVGGGIGMWFVQPEAEEPVPADLAARAPNEDTRGDPTLEAAPARKPMDSERGIERSTPAATSGG